MKRTFRERISFWVISALLILIVLAVFVDYRLFAIPLFVFVILLGLDVVFVNFRERRKSIRAQNWPVAYAELINGCSRQRRYDGARYKWYLEIEYQYAVSGRQYRSENYNWVGKVADSREPIERIVEDLRLRNSFSVRYNPENPGESVVVPELSLQYILGIVVGVILVLGAALGAADYFEILKLSAHYESLIRQ